MNPSNVNALPLQSPIGGESGQPSAEVANLLAKMHDISAPTPVSWWPLAPGWWVLLGVLIAIAFFSVKFLIGFYRRNAYRRQAIKILDDLKPECSAEFATEVSTLLKRVALTAYPEQSTVITQAFGSSWVNWLNQACPKKIIESDCALALSEAPYQPNIQFDGLALKSAAKIWVQNHV